MDSLSSTPVAEVLQRLHREAEAADAPLMQAHASNMTNIDDAMRQVVEAEAEDLTGLYRSFAANFLSVSPAFGRFLYMCARGCKAKRIVEFGAFVEIMPGTDGLLHVSEIANHRVKDVRDELKEGQQILVKVINIDPTGKIRLSRKALLQGEGAATGAPKST